MKQLVVIRLRSMIRATGDLRHANMILGLNRKNAAKLVNDTPSMRGMLQKLKDYITYGEIDSETLKLLKSTRAEVASDGTEKNCYRLHPPRGGFERKGTKKPFGIGGAAGDRKEKINDLLKRMIDL
ncbi:50S ribosomal protein L30 [Candidatus Woesearchaeota archaeon]|nr:50S ribosomal protein L30 [Candidatus Woesearchaeota archaeon]